MIAGNEDERGRMVASHRRTVKASGFVAFVGGVALAT